jgi:hypothetical protein
VDALYFAADLRRTVAGLRQGLRQGGKMGLFYSHVAKKSAQDRLEPDSTFLALALQKNGLGYGVRHVTASDHELWLKVEAGLADLESRFREEGHARLWRLRSWEAKRMVRHAKEGRTRRATCTPCTSRNSHCWLALLAASATERRPDPLMLVIHAV